MQPQFPLTTTTARIDACRPCCEVHRRRAMELLGITEPSDEPITYDHLIDVLGLDDALWWCSAEPQLAVIWRRYAIWCARQVEHLMADPRSRVAIDVAERHAAGQATDKELLAAKMAGAAAAEDAAVTAALAAAALRPIHRGARRIQKDAVAGWNAADSTAAAWAAVRCAAWCAADSAAAAAYAASGTASAATGVAMRQRQAEAFRQLVTTGELPPTITHPTGAAGG